MGSYRTIVVVVSAAFLVFSAVLGSRYDKLRKDRESIGRYNYGFSTPGQYAQDQAEDLRIDRAQERIHAIVKPVSIAYYLLFLGLFVRAWRLSPRRKVAILGAVACLFMTVWSIGVGGQASFDEVYPAWIVAALVLTGLSLAVMAPARAEVRAAA